jgi:hypothetical protein
VVSYRKTPDRRQKNVRQKNTNTVWKVFIIFLSYIFLYDHLRVTSAMSCYCECGTLTVIELLELDPAESVTVTVIVYIRPEPLPARSARNRM